VARSFLLACLLTLGCAGSESSAPSPVPEGRFVPVSGVVRDSILGEPVAGIRVFAGDSSFVTGPDGAFALILAQGRQALQAAPFAFEPLRLDLDLNSPRTFVLLLRRQAPAVIACVVTPAGLSACVLDLQGRKTVDRRFATSVEIESDAGSRRLLGHDLAWYPLSDLTWRVDLPGTALSRSDVLWNLADGDGFRSARRCSDAPAQAPVAF
jgi:hypothetical protein